MSMIITVSVEGTSPYYDGLAALRALIRTVENSSVGTPPLGGELRSDNGERVGSYLVEFK